jgi:predicted transcriptional regulator
VTACWTEPKSRRKDLQIKGFDFGLVSISPKYAPYKMWLLQSDQAEKTKMSTVTIGVASLSDTQQRASAAFRGKKQGARISFASEDLLWKTLTPKRWALLKLMANQGSMAIREIARRAGRDVRAVYTSDNVRKQPPF